MARIVALAIRSTSMNVARSRGIVPHGEKWDCAQLGRRTLSVSLRMGRELHSRHDSARHSRTAPSLLDVAFTMWSANTSFGTRAAEQARLRFYPSILIRGAMAAAT